MTRDGRMFRCQHEHVSGRRCDARLPYYGACSVHQRACTDCASMIDCFPLRSGQPVARVYR